MEKKRYEIQIADVDLAILSDEREDFVMSAVRQLDTRIRDLTVNNKRCSKMDAALLCSLDYFSDKLKAEKRVRNLEAQIALYDANMRRMREENLRLKARLGADDADGEAEAKDEAEAAGKDETAGKAETAEKAEAKAETEAEAAEKAETAKEAEAESAAEEKAENEASGDESRQIKLRQIESLLRK
jgi:hypothetical protein